MLDFIKEKLSVWENLQKATKPIVLYGMGNGADRILDKCLAEKIPVAGVFASDGFVRGQTFRSYPVLTYQEAVAKWGDFVVVIAFASEAPSVLANFFALAAKHETYAPHVALFAGDELVSRKWLEAKEAELETVYHGWADALSRQVMADALNYKVSGKIKYLLHTTDRIEDLRSIFTFNKTNETYADLGAYNGDTLTEFLELTGGGYEHIYALEPDRKNFHKLQTFVAKKKLKNCTLVHKAIWSSAGTQNFYERGGRMSSLATGGKSSVDVVNLDAIVGKGALTYLKMDVEGAEEAALVGGKQVIAREQPKVFIAAYHHDNDLLILPQTLKSINPKYELYLRRHPYVPCWELNILGK